MSYFVIKGPDGSNQYLCALPGRAVPQWWHERSKARVFSDEDSGYRWLASVAASHHDAGSYRGRVVRVITLADRRAEREQLRADLDRLRFHLAQDAGASTLDRLVELESAAGFVVRRAELAPEGSNLRERIERLRLVLEGQAADTSSESGDSDAR